MSKKKSFVLYFDCKKQIDMLSDEQAGKLFKALLDFAENGGVPEESLTFRHKSPYALLVPVINRPDAKRPFGHSRISRACMNLTQSALRTLLRSEVSAEFYSVPQKYILGLSDNADFNNRAAALSPFLSFSSRA